MIVEILTGSTFRNKMILCFITFFTVILIIIIIFICCEDLKTLSIMITNFVLKKLKNKSN